MALRNLLGSFVAVALLTAAPAFAQTASTPSKTTVTKQKTDGDGLTNVGPGSKSYKQRTDGDALTSVGSGSKAYKQRTDGDALTSVGSGSKAYKQRTDGDSPHHGWFSQQGVQATH